MKTITSFDTSFDFGELIKITYLINYRCTIQQYAITKNKLMKNKNNTGNGSKSTRIITGLEGAVAQAIAS